MDFILASFLKEIIVTLSNVSDAKDMLLNTIFAEMLMTSHSKLMYMVKIKEFYCSRKISSSSNSHDLEILQNTILSQKRVHKPIWFVLVPTTLPLFLINALCHCTTTFHVIHAWENQLCMKNSYIQLREEYAIWLIDTRNCFNSLLRWKDEIQTWRVCIWHMYTFYTSKYYNSLYHIFWRTSRFLIFSCAKINDLLCLS